MLFKAYLVTVLLNVYCYLVTAQGYTSNDYVPELRNYNNGTFEQFCLTYALFNVLAVK